jgi:hypothetical protein
MEEIIRLAEAGVDEAVMLAYVNKSSTSFNLGPDEIIYLNDIGVPSEVVMSIIQHDRALKDASIAPALATSAPVTSAISPPQYPAPLEGEDLADGMAPEAEEYPTAPIEPEPTAVSYSSFYDALQPYGNWVNVEGYGRCWQPTVVVVNRNWRPYCDQGRWVYTENGWYWLSGYSWGWAPFHYGRWFPHERLGWCWTPDVVWGPSWVTWRYTTQYCGWAPLPPRARFKPGHGLTVAGHPVPPNSDCGVKQAGYTFVPANRLRDSRLVPAVLPRKEVARIFDSTIVSTRFSGNRRNIVNNGLPTAPVVAATHSEVPRMPVRELGVRSPGNIAQESLEARNRTPAVRRPVERNLAHGEIRQPSPSELQAPIHDSFPERHQRSGSSSRPIAGASIESVPVDTQPLPSRPERAVLPVAQVPSGRSQSGLNRRANRQEIQTASVAKEDVSPRALIIRGRSEPPAALTQAPPTVSLPGQPAWVQTENPDRTDRELQARTTRGHRQAVLPRAEPSIASQPPAYESPQQGFPRQGARSQPMSYQAPASILPTEPQVVMPPAQMAPPPQMPPRAQMPERPWGAPAQAYSPPASQASYNDRTERHTRPAVEAQTRPAPSPAVEPRTGNSPSTPSSRAESRSSREDSGRRR